jgi:NADH-ubiquinone oxidoreductase chain 5
MLVIITGISFFVHFYSIEYMAEDPHSSRFFFYLTIFTFFMAFFVLSDNLVQLFFGWEGVGLASYLLINFWFTRAEASRAALKAVFINRVGDAGLYLAIICFFFVFKSVDTHLIFSNLTMNFVYNNHFIINIALFGIFLAALTKSAQIGLHIWLPDAMEGPTPVSALLHAATMVTAGVYLLLRLNFVLECSSTILFCIAIFGGLTAFYASLVGVFQNDIKKIIAYSTCSQLGYMFLSCGFSNYVGAIFHLFNHAFFKALLFLGAGAVINSFFNHEQDLRKMGSLANFLPLVYVSFLIGSLSLVGFPFLAGYYSKDYLFEFLFNKFTLDSLFVYVLAVMAAFFTAVYSIKIIYVAFLNKPNYVNKQVIKNLKTPGFFISTSLILLGFITLFVGYLCSEVFLGLGNNTFSGIFSENVYLQDYAFERLDWYIKYIPFFFFLFAAVSVFFLYYHSFYFSLFTLKNFFGDIKIVSIFFFFGKKWYFDYFFEKITKTFLNFVLFFFKLVDRGVLELLGPTGIVRWINKLGFGFSKLQTSEISNYLLYVLFTFLFFIFFDLNLICLFLFIYVLFSEEYN